MSQDTDAQNQTAEPHPTPIDSNRRGIRLLDTAIVIYLIALAAFVAATALEIHTETNRRAAVVLLMGPTLVPGAIFIIFYSVFLISSLAGVPLISFSNGLSAMQRNWRSIIGTVLLVSVALAVLTAASL